MHTGLSRRSSLLLRSTAGALALTVATSLAFARAPSAFAATATVTALDLSARTLGPAAPASEIERLYIEGQDMYGAGDFAAAAESWTRLLHGLPEAQANRATRENVLLNIIQADLDAYNRTRNADGSKDIEHLRTGKKTVDEYYTNFRRAYGDRASVSAAVQEKGDELEKLLKEAEQEAANEDSVTSLPPDPAPKDLPASTTEPDPGPTKEVIVLKPQSAGSGLIVGGAVAAAVGVGMLGLGIAGGVLGTRAGEDVEGAKDADEEEAARERGATANALMISGLVVAAVGLGAGAALLTLGIKRRREADNAAANALSVAPAFGPHFSGLALSGRF